MSAPYTIYIRLPFGPSSRGKAGVDEVMECYRFLQKVTGNRRPHISTSEGTCFVAEFGATSVPPILPLSIEQWQ